MVQCALRQRIQKHKSLAATEAMHGKTAETIQVGYRHVMPCRKCKSSSIAALVEDCTEDEFHGVREELLIIAGIVVPATILEHANQVMRGEDTVKQ